MRRIRLALMVATLLPGCASTRSDRAFPIPSSPADALVELQADGPPRFGVVHERLYRGGQPTTEHLHMLQALGVTKVIDLRRERLDLINAERATARQLGMDFVELPFWGVFGTDPEFLRRVVEEMRDAGDGAVYVHCDNGRDRTSLVVALYRVMVENWSPDSAWEREALAYGYKPRRTFREIELAFRENVHEHGILVRTAASANGRTREIAQIRSGGEERALAKVESDEQGGGAPLGAAIPAPAEQDGTDVLRTLGLDPPP